MGSMCYLDLCPRMLPQLFETQSVRRSDIERSGRVLGKERKSSGRQPRISSNQENCGLRTTLPGPLLSFILIHLGDMINIQWREEILGCFSRVFASILGERYHTACIGVPGDGDTSEECLTEVSAHLRLMRREDAGLRCLCVLKPSN